MRIAEVDKPEPTDEQVLVRVHATSVNAFDWHMLRGKPYIARLSEGLRQPKTAVLGLDVAGTVEAVGARVTHVSPGDRVFGSRIGAFAEYAAGMTMVPMPSSASFEQAAAVPTAGQTALQGLRDHGNLRPGQRVLVNGAGGGVGSFAVQIAKALGAEVTAVTSSSKLETMHSIGADEVIDYTREDFTRGGRRWDLVLDAGGNRSLRSLRRVLTRDGTIVGVAPAPGEWVGFLVRVAGGAILSRLGTLQFRSYLAEPRKEDLVFLAELLDRGALTPVIERVYPFEQIPDAVARLEAGGVLGKVVISLDAS